MNRFCIIAASIGLAAGGAYVKAENEAPFAAATATSAKSPRFSFKRWVNVLSHR